MNKDDIEEFAQVAISACEWRYRRDALRYTVIENKKKFIRVAIELEGRDYFPVYTVINTGECRETDELSRAEEHLYKWVSQVE